MAYGGQAGRPAYNRSFAEMQQIQQETLRGKR